MRYRFFHASMAASFTLLFAMPVVAGNAKNNTADKAEKKQEDKLHEDVLSSKVISELELDHSRSMDELSAVESRLNLLSKKLYDSQILVDYRGELDKPFRLSRIELYLDGTICYSKNFHNAPTVQALRLADMFLPPGRHVVELRVRALGPDDADDALPGYSSGASISAHLRPGSTTKVLFNVEQDGAPPSLQDLRQDEVESEWNINVSANSVTEKND